MQDMLVKPGIQELLKYNDMLLYQQQVKVLSGEFSNDLSLILYVLYYILFIYDESVLCLFIRCLMQLVLSYVMTTSSNGAEVAIPGLSRHSAFNRLPGASRTTSNTNTNTSTNSNENEPERFNNTNVETTLGTTESSHDDFEDIETLFSRWTVEDRVKFVQKILLCLAVGWGSMILYQLVFCLNDVFSGICYTTFGSLSRSIRESAYSDRHYTDADLWSAEKAFTPGPLLLNMIGETRLRSRFVKFVTIILLDFFIITIQLIEILLNYIVGFGIVERISENTDGYSNSQTGNREYDGRQGRTTILKLNPFEAFGKL